MDSLVRLGASAAGFTIAACSSLFKRIEDRAFTAGTTVLLVVISPIFLCHYNGRPPTAATDSNFYAKLAFASLLVLLELFVTCIRITGGELTETPIWSQFWDCIASLAVVPMLHCEHLYAVQPSSFITIYFAVSMAQDFVKSRSSSGSIGPLCLTIVATKFILILLHELPKRCNKSNIQKSKGGFWYRNLSLWLHCTIFFGFRNRDSVDSLPDLGASYASERLGTTFDSNWTRYQGRPNRLAKALFRSLLWSFVMVVPVRLLHIGLYLTQPFLPQRILQHIYTDIVSSSETYDILCTYVLVTFFTMVCGRTYERLNSKLATKARGMLFYQTLRKNYRLSCAEAKKSAEASSISSCIDDISNGILGIHYAWSNTIQFGLCVYFLSIITGRIALLLLFPAFYANVGIFWSNRNSIQARAELSAATTPRLSKTSKMLAHLKGVRMMGIESTMIDFVQRLREAEVKMSKRVYAALIAVYVGTLNAHSVMHIIIPGSLVFSTVHENIPDSTSVWTILAFVDMTMSSTYPLIRYWYRLGALQHNLRNMEEFLTAEESRDTRIDDLASSGRWHAPRSQFPVQFLHAEITPLVSDSARVLINAALERSTLTMVVGPEGSGKTTLLQALLGEANILRGSVYVEQQHVAYCDQNSWLRNITIRDNIVGENTYEADWYNSVINACMLHDLSELPDGDLSLAGIDGSNLSRGHKQRVVMARAIYTRMKIVVIDDMLSAVDRTTASQVLTRLFGTNGLLRSLGITAIMATQTTDILSAADALIILSWDGIAKLERGTAAIRAYATKYPFIRDDDIVSEGDSETDTLARHFRPEPVKPEVSNSLAPQAGIKVYSFYIGSLSKCGLLLVVLILAVSTPLERIPDALLRTLVEQKPDETRWFAVYATLQISYWIGSIGWLWIFYMHVVMGSAEGLHRKLIETVLRATPSLFLETEGLLKYFADHMALISHGLPRAFSLYIYSSVLSISELVVVSAATPEFDRRIVGFMVFILFVLHVYYLRATRRIRQLDQDTNEQLCKYLTETRDGSQHIRAFGWGPSVLNKSVALLDNSQKLFYYATYTEFWVGLVLDLSIFAVSVTLVYLATCSHTAPRTAIGPALVVLSQGTGVLKHLLQNWVSLDTSLSELAQFQDFIENTSLEVACSTNSAVAVPDNWPHNGKIEFFEVNSDYTTDAGDSHIGLRNFSIVIDGGTKVGLLGRAGSGKTTVFLTLLNFLTYSGEITIDGIEISRVPRGVLRSRITTISQDLVQLPCSVRDNVVPWDMNKPLEERTDDSVILQVLGQVGLRGYIMNHGGLGVELADVGLSHGQQQLLALARAVLHKRRVNSKIVLVDEPLNGLDMETEDRILDVMEDEFEDCTVLTIANRMASMDAADELLEISDGYLVLDD